MGKYVNTLKGHRTRIKPPRVLWALGFVLLVFWTTNVRSSDTATATTTSPQDILAKTATAASKTSNLFESLWTSFKQTLEQTSFSASSISRKRTLDSQSSNAAGASQTGTQAVAPPVASRRTFFLEQGLNQHYTQQLLSEYEGTDVANSKKKEADDRIEWQSRWEHPLRWHYNRCFYYTENAEAYWTFQWCPGGTIEQGFRTRQLKMTKKHVLGKYLRPSATPPPTKDNAYIDRFHSDVKQRFPSQTVQLYTGGDQCSAVGGADETRAQGTNNNLVQRIAAVVLHEEESTRCPKSITKGMETPLIESIDESQTCQYVVHVCLPTTGEDEAAIVADEDDDDVSQDEFPTLAHNLTLGDAKQMNVTMHHIKKLMHTYLHRNQATKYQKLHPDRTTSLHVGLPPLPPSRVKQNLNLIRDMFTHAYDSYMYHAFPASDIKPMTCKPAVFHLVRVPALTLLDSLDMLVILGNYTEFARSVERLRGLHNRMAQDNAIFDHMHGHQGGIFAVNQNVSVFEANIRILGGLLSAHQLAEAFVSKKVYYEDVYDEHGNVLSGPLAEYTCEDASNGNTETVTIPSEACGTSSLLECQEERRPKAPQPCQNRTAKYWHYNGFLLDLAQDIGNRLVPAFETKTGIPFGTINLLHGIPKGETTIASLAGGGTLSLEMELLSRLTGKQSYGQAAKLSARALWMRRSDIDLFGKHLCTHRGEWTESLSGVGSNSDSFYEYLMKHHILFPEDQDFWFQTVAAYGGVFNESRLGEWYGDVEMSHGSLAGGAARRVFEALMAFYPGMQVLMGELGPAARTLNSFFMVREFLGFLPERFNFGHWKVDVGGGKHFLRPELLESAYFLHRATKGFHQQFRQKFHNETLDSSGWQWAVDFSLHALEDQTRTACGYASLKEVSPATTGSLAEQDRRRNKIKLMDEMPSFFLSETLKYLYLTFDENNILHTDSDREWVFTTEAHPIHYSPKQKQHESVKTLRNRLKHRLKARIDNKEDAEDLQTWRFLVDEKWSDASPLTTFVQRIEPILLQVGRDSSIKRGEIEGYQNYHVPSKIVDTFLGPEQLYVEYDFFNETEHESNLAHLTFTKEGYKRQIARSCPNFYSSDLLWIRALNGGSTDYADAYLSTARDEVGESNSRFHMLGSIEALAIHGSGRHVAEVFEFSKTCKLGDKSQTPPIEDQNRNKQDPKERVALGNELGTFDVSTFPGGSGFFLQHVDSGEAVIATLIDDGFLGKETIESFIMVHATPATKGEMDVRIHSNDIPWNSKIQSILKLDDEILKTTDYDPLPHRAVVLSDLKGNAFTCSVDIIYSERNSHQDDELSDSDSVEVLATYPCAPALFGPTHISELNLSDGVVIEQEVRAPEIGDEYGCVTNGDEGDLSKNDETSDDVCEKEVVQILNRGVCTFQEKARNQQTSVNAEAVIMINNDPDELFIMSGASNEDPDHGKYPVTVLLTGNDGQDLLELLDTVEEEGGLDLKARVSLTKQVSQVVERNGKYIIADNNGDWPVVRASEKALQIFTRGGWGVHSMQRPPKSNQAHPEWQLYLMRFQTE